MTPPDPGHPPDDDPDEQPPDRSGDEPDDVDDHRDAEDEQPEETVSPVDSGRPAGGWADDGGDGRSLLSSLLRALDSLDRISGTGGRGRNRLEYDVSIDTGLGERGPRRGEEGRSVGPPGDEIDPRRERRSSRSRRTRRRPASSIPTTVQRRDDEVLVTADLSGVDPDAVTVGVDDDRLVIGVEGTELERVAVPWPEATTDARINNGVLSVQIGPGGADDE